MDPSVAVYHHLKVICARFPHSLTQLTECVRYCCFSTPSPTTTATSYTAVITAQSSGHLVAVFAREKVHFLGAGFYEYRFVRLQYWQVPVDRLVEFLLKCVAGSLHEHDLSTEQFALVFDQFSFVHGIVHLSATIFDFLFCLLSPLLAGVFLILQRLTSS